MVLRPRLLVVSLVVALGIGVMGGWILYRINAHAATAVMNTPGEYQEPLAPDLPPVEATPSAGSPLPDVVLTDADGLDVRSSDLVGDPLVINVWFSTCPPCARELADFAEVHAEVGDDVRFVGVNPFDGAESMTRFAAERGVTYELLRDDDGAFIDGVGLSSFPRTYFVDATGTIVGEVGEVHADDLRQMIEELF
jgi:peroxiredoxin